MRITNIDIKDFRAFKGEPISINLTKTGKNLLVYGENGSGKSSLFLALKFFLESTGTGEFLVHKNFFVTTDDGYVRLALEGDGDIDTGTYEWSKEANDTGKTLILEIDKTKGFIDYKALLATYFLHQKQDWVNVFDLLVQEVLCNVQNDFTKRSFGEDWRRISRLIPTRNTSNNLYLIDSATKQFNDGLRVKLDELTSETNKILQRFGYDMNVEFHFGGVTYNRASRRADKEIEKKEVRLKVKFLRQERDDHHHYLNEAKLSGLALSIFFAALQLQPVSRLRILALDDVLIGLDMANRMPVLDIIDEYFSNYQIFLFTYDNPWFEVVKRRWNKQRWKYTELRLIRTDNDEFILCTEDKPYLDKAEQYLQKNEYQAAVVHVRSGFEDILKSFCKKKLSVRYTDKPKDLDTNDFWQPIKNGKKSNGELFVIPSLASAIEQARSNVLNPLSHSGNENWHWPEIQNALAVVRKLKIELDSIGPKE